MKSFVSKSLLLLFLTIIGNSCANYKLNIAPEAEAWAAQQPPNESELKHRMYLVGDAGNAKLGKTPPVLKYLKGKLAEEGEQSSIIYLGDNIYPDGMPNKSSDDRELAEHRLTTQLEILDDFKGRPIFIPGNHDWRNGLKGLGRQEKFVNKYLNKGIDDDDDWETYFFPEGGCPGPDVLEINDQLVVIVVDSQWWLADWDKEPKIHDGCEVKNRFMFKFLFENAVRKYRNKNVVVALHHPLYTNGPHGGNFTLKDHIFPLTNISKNLYVPLPGIGTIATGLRKSGMSKQDISNPVFKELKEVIMAASEKNGNFIYVSGHEHSLQYLENEGQTFIVSGSGSKTSPSTLGKGSKFGYGKKGYSTIDFYEDGQAWTSFYVPNEDGTDAKLVFRQKTKDALSISEDNIPTEFPEYDALKDEKTIAQLPTRNPVSEAGAVQKFILGEHYRSIYLHKYDFPILDLGEFKGGMTPLKRGGGNQTNSLRMADPDGHQYVMRDLTKDVTRLLPPPFNKMGLTEYIALDNFLSTHPFAPLALPPLAEAANIYHTNPKFYYIPKQPTLGVYNDNYGGSVYLVEERPGGNWDGQPVFGGTKKTYGTPELSEKTLKNHKHKVDQNWALRSRLFDVVIGDWDRHDDQWRWARFDQEDGTRLYRPVPRDRDQAFSKYDGLVTRIATIASPFTHQLAVYGPKINSVKWSAWSPRNFDAQFFTELDWEDWEKEATFIKENISDELIEESFKAWPDFALEEDGDYIKSVLRKRRDRIVDYARRYYKFRAKEVDVIGTEDRELFEIQRINDNETIVRMFELSKKGKKKDMVYERTFTNDITKEIHLYGNGDDDEFRVSGEVNKGIKLRCIGGLGNDTFVDESKVGGLGKKTLFYDDNRKNSLTLGTEAKDKRTDEAIYNIYDRRAYHYEYNYTIPIPLIGSNPDDGFVLGAMFLNTTYNFKKEPFSSQHTFGGVYAFQTESFELVYQGDYLNTFGKLDFFLDATVKNPSYSSNYFGFGNGSVANVDSLGIDFYRIRQGLIRVYPAFKKRLGNVDNFLTFGPVFERSEIDDTPDRILTTNSDGTVPDDIFTQRNRVGAEFGFFYHNVDDRVVPHRGLNLIANAKWMNSLDNTDLSFTKLSGEMALYQNLDRKENLVFATRVGFGHIFGELDEDFFFDDAPTIGGESPLRGYREQRFYGNTSFYFNTDLRLRLFTTHNRVLPFTMGIFGGYDLGRVWSSEIENKSGNWHYSYGGGLWFSPLDAFTLSLGAFVPKEDTEESLRIVLQGGFSF